MFKNGDDELMIRRCFKCNESVISNLNIIYNASNSMVTLWNKFQIYLYEELKFNESSKDLVPEFQINNLICTSNYLVCLDNTGNIHTTPLKFKNAATQKRFKGSFQLREHSIVTCALIGEDILMSLKYGSKHYFLSIHKINAEFSLEKSIKLKCNEYLSLQIEHECILKACSVPETYIDILKTRFQVKTLEFINNYSLVVISFDRLTIYGCLFNSEITEEVTLVKLYTCPSQISNIDIINIGAINIIIGLNTGTIVILNLKEVSPKIVHLNMAIHKVLVFEDNILYTDGLTMWIAENILSSDIKCNQLFVKNVNDFIKFGDNIICTTFTNLIYTFSLDDEKSYIRARMTNEYCPAEKLIDASRYLDNVLTQVKDIDELIKKQKQERDYIMALSVSNRQDIMNGVLTQKVIVYNSYRDATERNTDAILTNKLSEYFETDLFYFLIKITVSKENKLKDILSNSIGDLRLHISIISENKIVKTYTLKSMGLLDNITLLMPLKTEFINPSEMRVDTKFVTNIPGAYDIRQKIWIVLYRKSIKLKSEHFIKFDFNRDQRMSLTKSYVSLEEQILEMAKHQYVGIIELTKMKPDAGYVWQMYIRLPKGNLDSIEYSHILKKEITKNVEKNCVFLSIEKMNYLLQQLTSADFLKSKSSIDLTICYDKAKIEAHNDGFTNPLIKISGNNLNIVLDIRNFLSNLLYCGFGDNQLENEFISHSFYITVENLQKAIKSSNENGDDVLPLIEQFERKVIGALPI